MRKANKFFLLSVVVIALLLAACTQPASTGEVTPQENDQLNDILDAVASQTPAASSNDGTGGGANEPSDAEETAVPSPVVPTEEPTEVPTATPVPIEVDLVVPSEYTLKKGEFPWCIARRFDIDAGALLTASGLTQSTPTYPGDVLKIPSSADAFNGTRALLTHPTDYTVKSGDTFYSIACKYGDVWPEEIAAQNGMEVTDSLSVGNTISIP